MKPPVLLAAGAVAIAGALLTLAAPPVEDVLTANRWLVPLPRIDVFMGPVETPIDPTRDDGPTGVDPPPPPVVYRTVTEITQAPSRIEKGDPFAVDGRVLTTAGEPVEGALVVLFLNETKEEPGQRVAKTRTGKDGSFHFEANVPFAMQARGYQIVAQTHDALNGRQLFLESWSDPETAVYSSTRLTLRHPRTAAIETPVSIEGHLLDVVGGPVRDATVVLTVDDEDVATTVTDGQGWYRFERTFSEPGRRILQVRYDGSTYYRPSSNTGAILVGGVGLHLQSDESVLRGEEFGVGGLVVGPPDKVKGVGVRVTFRNLSFDGESGFTYVSDASGVWGGRLTVDANATPGRYLVDYVATRLGIDETRTMRVEAETELDLRAPVSVGRDGLVNATATLVDDRGDPMEGRAVELRAGDARTRGWTDENGTVAFELQVPGGDHRLTAAFDGDALYRPSSASQALHVPVPLVDRARPWLLALAVLAALAALLAWLLRPAGRRALRRAAAALDPRTAVALAVDLPQVEPDLPDVWGVGETLVVEARANLPDGPPLAGLPLTLEAGGPLVASTDGSGLLRHEVVFGVEGVEDLSATFAGDAERRPAKAVRPVRIVEYRRVIEEGFEDLRRDLAAAGVPVHEATPPRELERRVAAALPDLPREDVDRLLTLFEVSDYSLQRIGRAEWITFHRTRRALRAAVPRVLEVPPRVA